MHENKSTKITTYLGRVGGGPGGGPPVVCGGGLLETGGAGGGTPLFGGGGILEGVPEGVPVGVEAPDPDCCEDPRRIRAGLKKK